MPLNLSADRPSRDAVPFIRYSAQSARWRLRHDGVDVELAEIQALIDLANTRTGWMKFEAGVPPDIVWDIAGKAAARPSKDHRRGFAVNLLFADYGLRELSATSTGLCAAIVKVYKEFEASPEAARGLVPLIQSGEVLPVENKYGKFYDPTLEITDWQERPEALPQPKTIASASTALRVVAGGSTVARDIDDDIPF
jgi:hypothetical protein